MNTHPQKRLAEIARACTRPPKGWVCRDSSIAEGNCRAGTDSFIRNRLIPHLVNAGWKVGDLSGAAIRTSLLLKLQRDNFTRRIIQQQRAA